MLNSEVEVDLRTPAYSTQHHLLFFSKVFPNTFSSQTAITTNHNGKMMYGR